MVNCIVVWNTRYMQAALNWLEAMSEDTLEADVSRLSPLKHKHINMLGRYHFEQDDLARDGHLLCRYDLAAPPPPTEEERLEEIRARYRTPKPTLR